MKVEFETNNIAAEISAQIAKLPEMTEKQEKKLFKKVKDIISGKLIRFMPRSKETNRKNFDGSRPYIHMQDDIKGKINSKDGFASITIMGGKKTAFKWHLLDDGARFPDGRVKNKAYHFTEKAMKAAEPEIEALLDALVEEIADGIGDEDNR